MKGFLESLINPLLAEIERVPEREPYPAEWVRLDLNERVGPAREVLDGIRDRLTPELLSRYPSQWHLYRQLAASEGVPVDHLVLVPGSDAAIKSICHVLVAPGDRVAMIDPSYAMYPVYTRMFGGVPVAVPPRPDLDTDLEGLRAAARRAKVVLLANPNQPTGGCLEAADVFDIVREAARTDTIVVADEAYFPFSGVTMLPHVLEHRNLVVVRTFSKAYGLAGLRLGFVASGPALVRALYKVRTSFDINAFATLCAQYLLEHPELVDRFVHDVAESGALLQEVAARYGLPAPRARANFQLIRIGPRFDPKVLADRLKEQGYVIRAPFPDDIMRDWVRITLGEPAVLRPFAARFAATLESMGARLVGDAR